ncbi:hypothetical protein FKM82_006059 [Ascaphus truei]
MAWHCVVNMSSDLVLNISTVTAIFVSVSIFSTFLLTITNPYFCSGVTFSFYCFTILGLKRPPARSLISH